MILPATSGHSAEVISSGIILFIASPIKTFSFFSALAFTLSVLGLGLGLGLGFASTLGGFSMFSYSSSSFAINLS